MQADLSAVRQKIARAKEKLDALSAEVALYMDPPPYRFTVETEGYRQAIVCHIDREPNPDWAHELAEIAYQARSSLDLLIPELVVDSGNKPSRSTQFPIFCNRETYFGKPANVKESSRDRMLRGVARAHRRIIDEYQPYHRSKRVEDDPLAVLNTVSNRDKHNDIYVAVAACKTPQFKLRRTLAEDLTVKFQGKLLPYPMTDGEELIALTWNPPDGAAPGTPNLSVHLEVLEMDPDLAFHSDRTIGLADIERAVLTASQIIERFATRLKPTGSLGT
jgi:hypothetical protein